jgi:hypothetical protein
MVGVPTGPTVKEEETTDAGESPRRKHTAFRIWRKFEIKDLKSLGSGLVLWMKQVSY